MKKKYYLYHQTRTVLDGLTFAFFDKFDSQGKALAKAEDAAKDGLWKVWKIEEVYEFYKCGPDETEGATPTEPELPILANGFVPAPTKHEEK